MNFGLHASFFVLIIVCFSKTNGEFRHLFQDTDGPGDSPNLFNGADVVRGNGCLD